MPASQPPVVISVVLAAPSIDALCGENGSGLIRSYENRIPDGPDLEIRTTVAQPMRRLLDDLRAEPSPLEGASVVVVGLVADLEDWSGARGLRSGPDVRDEFSQALEHVIGEAQARGATVLALNESTFDPDGPPVSYRESGETAALLLHRLNAVLIEHSMAYGISILDVDRVLAVDGAAERVKRLGSYTEQGSVVIREELLRVLEDYGFFDDRPILEQIGRKRRQPAGNTHG